MTSVERIHEYHHLPEEANAKSEEKTPPLSWPHEGAISISNLSYAYFEDGPMVLKNVCINILPKEKVFFLILQRNSPVYFRTDRSRHVQLFIVSLFQLGIVGRTGAGKSSIVASLFRMSDQIFGSIKIDGFDANEVDLYKWRNALTIIPQVSDQFDCYLEKSYVGFSAFSIFFCVLFCYFLLQNCIIQQCLLVLVYTCVLVQNINKYKI